jgi:hypothetical protein
MAEVVASHYPAYKWDRDFGENVWMCTNRECNFGSDHFTKAMDHVAEQLAANGYGKLEDAWENGRTAGYDAGSRWARTGEEKDTPSPYRRPE